MGRGSGGEREQEGEYGAKMCTHVCKYKNVNQLKLVQEWGLERQGWRG
jgi:hypothetical protein